ncbi:nucleolar protein 8 [Salminus brasiliensis]|uniref:nucleolar protein 8 n=1 Tax=Salminus brasiliensis TaxID=930266 RepID=UPI003B82E949
MKRLYVGGLSHTISEKDLRDRFGKFGEVSDVEIITRKDEDGSPLKTFGYINISISDSEYKRCMTVLNKSKWKGGTLQIELAKESFLHRLAEERQKEVEKVHTPRADPQDKLAESFKAAGVENFHMKAAVPGTEIPGQKNWVVSKFGRVLPVLHLKCQGKNKVIKYDPSKHCHNIKKLDTDEGVTPVSKLTWEMDGGYDDISKKRRGEFPPLQKKCPKKIKKDLARNDVQCGVAEETGERRTPGRDRPVEVKSVRKSVRVFDSDADSEDEIRKLVAQERSKALKIASTEEERDTLEVVGDDFMVKSDLFWGGENGVRAQLALKSKDDEEYDSADTDEILTQSKTPGKTKGLSRSEDVNKKSVNEGGDKSKSKKTEDSPKPGTDSEISNDGDESSSESVDSEYEAMMGNCYRLELSLADLENLVKNTKEAADDEEESDDSVSEPEAGLSEISPQRAASQRTGHNPEDILAFLFGPDVEEPESKEKKKKAIKPPSSLPAFIGTKDLFGSTAAPSGSCLKRPADKLDGGTGEEPKRLKEDLESNDQPSEPSHQHLSASVEPQEDRQAQSPHSSSESECSSSSDEMDSKSETIDRTDPMSRYQTVTEPSPQEGCSKKSITSDADFSETSDEEEEEEEEEESNSKADAEHSETSDEEEEEEENNSKADAEHSETSDEEEEEEESNSKADAEHSETSDDEEEEGGSDGAEPNLKGSHMAGSKLQTNDTAASRPRPPQPSVPDAVKQQQDNRKRLAAVEERQKEAEQQKKLIQGALSALDVPNANKGKHIVFDSDDEDDDDGETSAPQKKSLFAEQSDDDDDDDEEEDGSEALGKRSLKEKEGRKAGGSKLFDSSEDEDDDAEDGRFQIKPQFEGRAGQKLMELQSRFGTDPRFQMDAKFLEKVDETEEQDAGSQMPDRLELVEEKKKNLAILQSVVNVSVQSSGSKESTKGKTFRDISALHYDPTSEAHAAFETKPEKTPEKESKAARRRKRQEAAKLPEVSKDIYYDVTVDLKEVFGTTKEEPSEKKEELTWDKKDDEHEEAEQDTPVLSALSKTEEDSSSGFKFSFFGDDSAAETTSKIDEYKIETLKGAKVSWQADPRFQDSSSDEEDVEKEEEKNTDQSPPTSTAPEEPAPRRTFFFHEGDVRLIEGPRLFCRRQTLEEIRAGWEAVREMLKQDVRKKHRDAVRLQRSRAKK